MNILPSILLALWFTNANPVIPPLNQNDEHNQWITLPSGLVVVQQGRYWVAYPAAVVPCDSQTVVTDRQVVFSTGGYMEACYLIYTVPIGYYIGDVRNGKKFEMRFYLIE